MRVKLLRNSTVTGIVVLVVFMTIVYNTGAEETSILAAKCCPEGDKLDEHGWTCIAEHAGDDSRRYKRGFLTILGSLNITAFKDHGRRSADNNTDEAADESEELTPTDQLDDQWLPRVLRKTWEKYSYLEFRDDYMEELNCSRGNGVRIRAQDTHRYDLLENGTLVLKFRTTTNRTTEVPFDPLSYCIDNTIRTDEIVFLTCPCNHVHCASKCCPGEHVMTCDKEKSCGCTKMAGADWYPFPSELKTAPNDFPYEILNSNSPLCDRNEELALYIAPYPPHNSIFWVGYPKGSMYAEDSVCADTVYVDSRPHHNVLQRCVDNHSFEARLHSTLIYGPLIPATLLLAVTLVLAMAMPKKALMDSGWMHNVALTNHAGALFVFNGIRVPLMFGHESDFCPTYTIVAYFFLLSAALWLSVMCINIARGFGLKQNSVNCLKNRLKMFFWYCLYAWGSAASLTTFAAFMWYYPHVPNGMLRPSFVETRTCYGEFLDGPRKISTFAYYFAPLGGLLIVNISLYVFTICKIQRLKKDTSLLNRQDDGEQAIMYVKLMSVMGVVEMTFEFIGWATSSNFNYETYFAVVLNFMDLVRAASIFALLCCNRRALRMCSAAAGSAWAGLRPSLGLSTTPSGTHPQSKRCPAAHSPPTSYGSSDTAN